MVVFQTPPQKNTREEETVRCELEGRGAGAGGGDAGAPCSTAAAARGRGGQREQEAVSGRLGRPGHCAEMRESNLRLPSEDIRASSQRDRGKSDQSHLAEDAVHRNTTWIK